jgi:hypothetical protein
VARRRPQHEPREDLEYGLYPFVPGDMFKLYLAAGVLPTAWRLVGGVRGDTRT